MTCMILEFHQAEWKENISLRWHSMRLWNADNESGFCDCWLHCYKMSCTLLHTVALHESCAMWMYTCSNLHVHGAITIPHYHCHESVLVAISVLVDIHYSLRCLVVIACFWCFMFGNILLIRLFDCLHGMCWVCVVFCLSKMSTEEDWCSRFVSYVSHL